MSQIARGSYKTGVTVGRIPKPSGIGRREPLARRLQQADQNTSQGNVLPKNLPAVYPGLEEKTYQLTYCQKFPNLTTQAVRSNGHNYLISQRQF